MAWPIWRNYCGAGWTGGKPVAPGEMGDFRPDPTDPLDEQCKTHDWAVGEAEIALKAGDLASYWAQILAADQALVSGLKLLLDSMDQNYDGTNYEMYKTAAFVKAGITWKIKFVDASNLKNAPMSPQKAREIDEFLWGQLPLTATLVNGFSTIPGVSDQCNRYTTAALNWVAPRRDPLVLDLDGGGIATSAINPNAPILFDQDGDGTLTATGWIAAGEAIVVRDLDGNGLIDSGRELFGDSTVLTRGPNAGQLAANGFAALADLDADASGVTDGKFDVNDAAFNSVRLWQDTNQDGVSQAAELHTFAELGVDSIFVAGTAGNVNLGGGNTQTFSGSFTRVGGTTGDAGTAELAGSLLLVNNNFYRQFTDDPVLTAEALNLPQMQGSGTVRDLRPAMSLGTTQAAALQAAVNQFAAGTTSAQQRAELDVLVQAWGATSTMPTSIQTNRITNTYASTTLIEQFAHVHPEMYAKITALEYFNGSTVLDHWVRAIAGNPVWMGDHWEYPPLTYEVSYSEAQATLIGQAYDALKDSVYGALVVQTRLKPYLDSIGLVIDESGVHFDTTATIAMVQDKAASDTLNAVADLLDIQKYAGDTAAAVGWQPYQTLGNVLETATITPEIQSLLTAAHMVALGAAGTNYTVVDTTGLQVLGNAASNVLTSGNGSDSLYGLGGNDTLQAYGYSDTLDGGDGADILMVAGSQVVAETTFIGGTGNDIITGAYQNNTYIFNAGDGQDTVNNYNNSYSGYTDVLKFSAGIAAADVMPLRSGVDLVFKLSNGSDQITVKNWFNTSQGYDQIEQVQFTDGTIWTSAQINTRALEVFGSNGADTLTGVQAFTDVLRGGDGNDSLQAIGNDDVLDGGDGDDTLSVGISDRGTTFIGGRGNDTITGSGYGDSYVFNAGDGQDTIHDAATGWTKTDVLRFGADVAVTDVTPLRSGQDLVFKLANGTDQITVTGWFDSMAAQINLVQFTDGTVWTNVQINTRALEVFGSNGTDTLTGVQAFTDVLRGGDGNDSLQAIGNDDVLDGGDGDDTLSVGISDRGTTFIGGRGNDTITGSGYSDSYVFNAGDGQDTIHDAATGWTKTDVLRFGADVAVTDVTPLRSGQDLVFKLANGTDQITVTGWFDNGYSQIEQVQFTDGTIWSKAQVNTRALEVFGTSGADTLTGISTFVDVLHGGDGNDTLQAYGSLDTLDGGNGNDILSVAGSQSVSGITFIGGTGNDTITGAYLSNTYVFNAGDGQDTINNYNSGNNSYTDVLQFGAGIAAADVTPLRVVADLVFKLANGTDQVTIKNWFNTTQGWDQIEQVKFADGTTWTTAQVNTRALEVFGTSGADTLTGISTFADVLRGGDGNDTLQAYGSSDTLDGGNGADVLGVAGSLVISGTTFIGGTGNDTITGGYQGNTYVFNAGDGQDTVNNYNNSYNSYTDVLKFGAGIAAADVMPLRSGVDLVFKLSNGSDQITVKNWFNTSQGYDQIEQVQFTDGTIWSKAQINTRALEVFGTSGADTLTGISTFVDVLHGGDGNDILQAYGSSDTLDGGNGADVLGVAGSLVISGTTFMGGTGNDTITGGYQGNTYVFNAGDGQDTVNNYNNSYNSYTDVLKFGAGIAAADVTPLRSGVDLVFKLSNGSDQITVKNWFNTSQGYDQIEQVQFTDGTIWSNSQINSKLNVQTGTTTADTLNGLVDRYNMMSGLAGNDVLNGANSSDRLDGGAGDDVMAGQAGNDTYIVDSINDVAIENAIEGVDFVESSVSYTLSENVENLILTGSSANNGSGNSASNLLVGNSASNGLSGEAGDDTLDGKAGADSLVGGTGNDTYVMGRGYGADLVSESDATAGNTDVAFFSSDIASNQLWFSQVNNDLEVSVIGTSDKFTINNWYLESQYHVEQFKTSNGQTLLDSQVQNLVDAMAAFAPPAAGQTTLPSNYATALAPVIAANWQ